jgi:Mg2+-importing ATPase
MTVRQGLTSAGARDVLRADGPNKIATKNQRLTARQLLKQFTSPIVLILFVATIISMLTGDISDGLIILAIIIPSGLLGFWQEHRANTTMQQLLGHLTINCNVIRDGVEQSISVEDVVLGDLVALRAGNLVPADLKLVESQRLMADESSLTGEAFPVEKSVDTEVFFGTSISSGDAMGVVVRTGNNTKFGALVRDINQADIETSFERGTRSFGILLTRAMGLLVVIILAASLIQEKPAVDSLMFALALAVGLTPQMLPVIISVSLAAGARAMAKQKVVVKRLDAIEDFGSISALCTDKTGTITLGVIELDASLNCEGQPDSEVGQLAYLNATLQQGFQNPLDEAIAKVFSPPTNLPHLVAEIPYDFERRAITILTSDGTAITKGAFAEVLAMCTTAATSSGTQPLSEVLAEVNRNFEQLSAAGNRVLALATKQHTDTHNPITETDLTLQGLLVFRDPPKPGAAAAIAEFKSLGIDVFIITGDNALVAQSLAKSVGVETDGAITGEMIHQLSDAQLMQRIKTCRVFASVDPMQKEHVIKLLQASGHTVGFFGDGINDAVALRAADVGISVDNAVDIAKSSAAIVLLDKDLAVIANGIRLGRKTFVNTIKYIRVTISANFGNVLSMAITSMFLPFLPLLPSQILLLNFMSDFPDLTIAGDNVDDEDIDHPRSWDIKYVRNFMITFGLISSTFDLMTFGVLIWGMKVDTDVFRSAWFVESTLTELAAMLILRSSRPFWRSRPSRLLLVSSLSLAAIVIILPFTAIGAAVKLVAIPFELLGILLAIVLGYIVVNEIAKRNLVHN